MTCLIGASDEKPEVSANLDAIGAARERTRRAVQPSGSAPLMSPLVRDKLVIESRHPVRGLSRAER